MMLSRRQVLAGAAGLASLSAMPQLSSAKEAPILRASPGTARIGPADQAAIPIWGYDGTVPGPEIRLAQGERLIRRFVNELPQASTVHWHGIRIANAMDGVPDEPLVTASRGESLWIEMINDTAWPHAMHLHGHHFRQVRADGSLGPLRDTLLVERDETAEIAFVADNPGDWLLHCHMLEHAVAGMMTWIRVES